MKKEAAKEFTSSVLHTGADFYSISRKSLEELAGFENYIYGGMIDNKEVVLRFCHSTHRNKTQIEGEMDWLFYLKEKGSSVCGPIRSKNNLLVEEVTLDDTAFYISAFEKAVGSQVDISKNRDNTTFFYRWGKALGELHRLSKDYKPSLGILPRDDYMEMSSKLFTAFLPNEPAIKQKINILLDEIPSIPKTRANYFLTHTDLHAGNFFYDQERLWIFDFDDCAYHYLVHDLAMPLFYTTWLFEGNDKELAQFSESFFTYFLAGYLKEYSLPLYDIQKLPLFLRLRDCDLYAILHKEWEGTELTPKRRDILTKMGQRIINDQPIVPLPYEKLYEKAKQMK